MSGAHEDSAGDARLESLLHSMRAFYDGDTSARVPVVPGQNDQVADLCRLFNAIAEHSALIERRLELARGESRRAAAAGGAAAPAPSAAIVVFEDASQREALEPMRTTAQAAVRGLGGSWERATVLSVRSPEDVRDAVLGGHRIVCALLDARSPREPMLEAGRALEAAASDAPTVYFAPEGDPGAAERAAEAAGGHSRAEIVRSIGQASERLTLHWLTNAPGSDDVTADQPERGYGQQRFEGEKVLIVDDDVRNVFAMVSALELYGLTAVTADSGYEALEILERTPDISVVLMDLMMPGLDGYATTARIRAHESSDELPIIAVTARTAQADRERSRAAGINEHVTKPVEVEHLLSLIRGLLQQQR
ncbi:response regulator [Actinospica durhamensis]|uniref:Response regulator n=1 Tax=Actinospica durhamensis TaxID=1508375 RepID=A0A941EV27_9ACTN|nr:response regulator [Actinospica durhamensis]MBR7837516.1 response regulator [Actinospica durhamensis]